MSRKNQITLPVAALRAATVSPGDRLRVEVVSDGVFRLVRERDTMCVAALHAARERGDTFVRLAGVDPRVQVVGS